MIEVRELRPSDLNEFLRFTDINIGKGYFSEEKARKIISHSYKDGIPVSFVMVEYSPNGENIVGVRLSYPPGQWLDRDPRQPIHPDKWNATFAETGYFQSLFIDEKFQGQGWGVRLSDYSIKAMKSLGAKAIVCHSWDESPNNSSRKYLDRLGFKPVVKIPEFWKVIDYECTRCGNPCLCTATEMIYYMETI